MKMSGIKQIIAGFVVLLVLIGILGSVAYTGITKLHNINEIVIEELQTDMKIDETVGAHLLWLEEMAGSIIKKEVFTGELDPHRCQFGVWYDGFQTDNYEMRELCNAVEAPHKELHTMAKKVTELQKKGAYEEAGTIFLNEMEPITHDFLDRVEKLVESSMREVAKHIKEEESIAKVSEGMVASTSILVFVLGIVIAIIIIIGLKKVVNQLGNAITQITSASNEILSASQEQASGAREQSSAVAETSSAAKELSSTSEQVGASIRRVSEAAGHALAGMGKIKESISKTGGMITSLGERSQKIGKITELIDDVADQTNLLAVNASIEAARAGEQGKGFTVVADEIRKLSDSTAKSTKDITSLIELIQHEMTNSIMSMESSVKSVDEEARLAHDTTERSKEIAMSATQQISGSKQIAEAMTNIDEAMKQIAAGAQQTQTAVKQLNELGKELKAVMEQLR